MKKLLMLAVLVFGFEIANATQVSYQAEVVTALNPYEVACHSNVAFHNDLVENLYAGYGNVQAFVVSEPQYCSHNELVSFVQAPAQVKVVVQRGIFARLGFSGFNQTVVQCVQKSKVGNKVQVKVVSRRRFLGLLTGANRRSVQVAVSACQ